MKKLWLIIFFLSLFVTARSQSSMMDSIFVLPDTARSLTLQDFYQLLIHNHPVARQSAMLSDVAKQEIRLARGHFDPKLESQFVIKQYDNTTYYQLLDGALKFPTRSPVHPVVGVERNEGKYLNPENYISDKLDYQQTYIGVSIPLGRGLVTDERRTAIKQAEVFSNLMEAEQVKIINKLLLEAAKDYWQWFHSYYNYRVAYNTTKIGEEIFRRVKLNFGGGETSPIDTVQAKITLLERQLSLQEALVELKNSTLKVSTYLWDSLSNPVDLPMQFVPVSDLYMGVLSQGAVEELVNNARLNHPELQKLNLKLQHLELDERLAKEYMKPKLDVSYYMLDQPFNLAGSNRAIDFGDNYKMGIDFSIPLFLRRERAKLAQTKLKINATTIERDFTTRQVTNEINTAYNYLQNNALLLAQQQSMVENYERLVKAELINLANGESDLFKINVQQEKLFQSQSKLLKVMSEYEKQKAVLYWAAGSNPVSR